MARDETMVMMEESLRQEIDQARKQEYFDGRDSERSRSDVINGAIALMLDQPIDDDLLRFFRAYGAEPERVIERLARHARCAECGHVWRLSKPIGEYHDGPRCSGCGSFDVDEVGSEPAVSGGSDG